METYRNWSKDFATFHFSFGVTCIQMWEFAKFCIKTDLTTSGEDGDTALHLAAQFSIKPVEIVKLLIEKKEA